MISEGQGCGFNSVPKEGPSVPNRFRYKEIEDAADSFRALLGQGALARVYKGILNDGTVVRRSGWMGRTAGGVPGRGIRNREHLAYIPHATVLLLLRPRRSSFPFVRVHAERVLGLVDLHGVWDDEPLRRPLGLVDLHGVWDDEPLRRWTSQSAIYLGCHWYKKIRGDSGNLISHH
ncbi:hypothetical protein MLD38_039062 [Melastoma candidum]|uniref:Uncharacterized protein n=1 Tax=Melastoma candidum TaxID=119954 RepID=A0ACB9L0W6_9MYRT|nr:hypothetical protein MLD38_039062 [Melastoma candidum]